MVSTLEKHRLPWDRPAGEPNLIQEVSQSLLEEVILKQISEGE